MSRDISSQIRNMEVQICELQKQINDLQKKVQLSGSDNNEQDSVFLTELAEKQKILDMLSSDLTNMRSSYEQTSGERLNAFVDDVVPKKVSLTSVDIHKQKAQEARERHAAQRAANRKIGADKESVKNQNIKKSSDLESTIGKSVMGIFAAILICISFVLVGIILIPSLTDLWKTILMFTVSCIFLFYGVFRLRKYPSNSLYIAITACGFICLYVSLMLSYFRFGLFTYWFTYLFIFLWLLAALYLSKTKSKIFLISDRRTVFIIQSNSEKTGFLHFHLCHYFCDS